MDVYANLGKILDMPARDTQYILIYYVHSVVEWNRKMQFTPNRISTRCSIALAFSNLRDQTYFK